MVGDGKCSDGIGINLVVILVGAEPPDVHDLREVNGLDHQTVAAAIYVKHKPPAFQHGHFRV